MTSIRPASTLAPAVVGRLYWKRATKYGAIASILAGEATVLLSYFRLIQWPGVLPVIPVVAVAVLVQVGVSLLTPAKAGNAGLVSPVSRGIWPWAALFLAFFVLGNDF